MSTMPTAGKPSDIRNANIDDLVAALSTEEAISLTLGVGNWFTAAVPRLGIPAINVTDGPNGARGRKYFMSTPAKCIPCGTAMAATWDTELVGEVAAKILAPECRLKAASVLLGPTCNIQRNPLGGRSFESFSEDPHLNGMMASSYIARLQEEGISACIKHFVGNEQEQERRGSDSIITERALREIYLYPFMLAQKHAKPWSYMTAYNRINGIHCSEHPWLLTDLLRKEWGFDGLVMSDWRGTYGVPEAYNAGLDLEMPGTDGWRQTSKVIRSMESKKLSLETVKARARTVVEFVKKVAESAPDVLDGDQTERTHDTPEDAALRRKVASSAIVLLKNEGNILPLKKEKIKTLAIIGPSAKQAYYAGGGSASLNASYVVTPYEGIVAALSKDVQVLHAEGCQGHKRAPILTDRDLTTPDGKPRMKGTFYLHRSDSTGSYTQPTDTFTLDNMNCKLYDSDIFFSKEEWYLVLEGKLRPVDKSTKFRFGLTVSGRAKLFVDGELLIDQWSWGPRGETSVWDSTAEVMGDVELQPGKEHEIRVEFSNLNPSPLGERAGGWNRRATVRLGGFPLLDEDEGIREAVQVAKRADAVVVVVGLNGDWESEGYDRTDLKLPRRTDELVAAVLSANPNAVLVTQAGSAFTMPWISSAHALLHTWYLGNETGHAIASVLFGAVNPSGKLSLTFPKWLEDVPSYLNYGNQNGKVRYAEDLFVGYRHYLARGVEPLFPFGFGLSYTTFEYSDLEITKPSSDSVDFEVVVSLSITNTGSVSGSEAVQLYIALPPGRLTHPPRALKAFTKVRDLPPGQAAKVEMKLDKYAVSYWDDALGRWRADEGVYEVLVGRSSEDLPLRGELVLGKGFTWSGL